MQRRVVTDIRERFVLARARWVEAAPPECGPGPALFELVLAARFYAELPRALPERFRLLGMLLGDPRQLVTEEDARKTVPIVLGFLGDVRALFDAAHETGALAPGDAMRRTLALWAGLHGALSLDKITRFDPRFDAGRLALDLARTLLLGWGADPELLGAANTRAASLSTLPADRAGRI
jgi:hypothetical protein